MSASAPTPDELEPVRAMLAADGYALTADTRTDERTLLLEVTATADACEDCLAPASVIAAVARSCLPEGSPLAAREIEVRLPAGGHES